MGARSWVVLGLVGLGAGAVAARGATTTPAPRGAWTGAVLLAASAPGAEPEPQQASTRPTKVLSELVVSPGWLAAHLSDPGLVVVQVGRDASEYAAGHIPGARFLALSAVVAERDGVPNELPPVASLVAALQRAGVADGARVTLYGAPLAAARVFFTLDYLGHGARAAILDGGLPAWQAAGRPLSTAAPAPLQGVKLTPRGVSARSAGAPATGLGPEQGGLVVESWVRAHLGDVHVALLDARPAAQFEGAEAGHGVARAGHIPGARSLYWEQTLTPGPESQLRSVEALRGRFEAAGATPGTLVVTYCRTGMQASWLYFVARYLGYEARMYDGSFIEWSNDPAMPVAR